MNYQSNDPQYMQHIEGLPFNAVTNVDKGHPYNILGECHRNCENYTNAFGGSVVYGWLSQDYGGKRRYLLHSCIREQGVIINITPPPPLFPTNLFAEDGRVQLDPDVTDIFKFLDRSNQFELPRYFERPL